MRRCYGWRSMSNIDDIQMDLEELGKGLVGWPEDENTR